MEPGRRWRPKPSVRPVSAATSLGRCIAGWFEHADQPAEGRFDGENSNFGTVTIEDRVYDELTREMAAVNPEAEAMHSAAVAA